MTILDIMQMSCVYKSTFFKFFCHQPEPYSFVYGWHVCLIGGCLHFETLRAIVTKELFHSD